MKIIHGIQPLVLAGALATIAGCGSAAISPQLADARAVMAQARAGSAQRVEPDEVLVAQRTLTLAEQQQDGSVGEIHYAYVAERQTRAAMANARTSLVASGVADDEQAYQAELERVARARGVAIDSMENQLADRQQTVERQQGEILAGDAALAAETAARQQAEANAAAALERLRALASVRVEATETVITLSGEVLFQTNRSELRPEARERLSAVAEAMSASPDQNGTVVGYTDSRGSDSDNQRLSQARADTVRDFLVTAGVPAASLRSEGRGEASPIASNDSGEGRANNRRVEIILRPSSAQSASR